MSILDKDNFLNGTFSPAGKASAEKYYIIFKKKKNHEQKKKLFQDIFISNIDSEDSYLKGKEKKYGFEYFRNVQTPKQKTNKDIKKYFKEYIQKQIDNDNKCIKIKSPLNLTDRINHNSFSPKKKNY